MVVRQALSSQPYALKNALQRAGIGKESAVASDVVVQADMPVEVRGGVLYYCRMQHTDLRRFKIVSGGLGNHMPESVCLQNLRGVDVPDGVYTMMEATVTLNGHVEVAITEKTEFVPA